MFRSVLSFVLIFAAIGWSALSLILIFLVAPAFWEGFFGKTGGAVAAVAALAGAVWLSAQMMRFSDRLLEEGGSAPRGRRRLAAVAPPSDNIEDWRAYSDDIVRNKRWAFYRRTRQFDRLARLEEQRRQAAAGQRP